MLSNRQKFLVTNNRYKQNKALSKLLGYTIDIDNHPYGFKYYNCPHHNIEDKYSIVLIGQSPSGHCIILCVSQKIQESKFIYDPNLKHDDKSEWGSSSNIRFLVSSSENTEEIISIEQERVKHKEARRLHIQYKRRMKKWRRAMRKHDSEGHQFPLPIQKPFNPIYFNSP